MTSNTSADPPEDAPPRAGSGDAARGPGGRPKPTAAEKLARRMSGLPDGRYELILTIGEGGLLDWSIRWFGKVERP